ncbi:ribosomal large subunit pseudouridine synthase A [Luminiphilus syltensis NOR5-1B]|uniref:Ribosomal large subunit pseudouridine synthase A n=1 Tax=Luminiphilus syltensis NOR5-1B TaxID=565045 RepID=B8KQK6_9GAMM|nr:pseudouridine synthase [Luminiphilus syltensis]EED34580.1 ribosomal large subunit pseudouridine synthase A [Luminiphilus syltensis NOR5-1B]
MITDPATPDSPPYLVPHTREPIRLLYQDNDLLIVEKPTLLLSVPGRHPLNRDSLMTRLMPRFPDVAAVHRLDLDTSGLMVVPTRRSALSALGRLFQERRVEKEYLAVVWGVLAHDSGTIDLPIIADWHRRPLQKICHDTGKSAITRYTVLKRGTDRTLLRLNPVTGRSHQLRIHCREIGHPILGCDLYAHADALAAAPRLLLHATRLAFPHPTLGHRLAAVSPAPFGV